VQEELEIYLEDVSQPDQQERVFDDLRPGEWIHGNTIADSIEVTIQMSNVSLAVFAPDPNLDELARRQNLNAVLLQAFKFELYNYDVLLQQMWTDAQSHFILGGIIFKIKTVFIMDSLKKNLRIESKTSMCYSR
jgi:hypothetical protein